MIRRKSKRDFKGANKYVYLEEDRLNYIYANYDIAQSSKGSFFIEAGIITVIYLLALLLFGVSMLPGKKLSGISNDHYFENRVGAEITNQGELTEAMDYFYQENGISPAVIIMERDYVNYFDNPSVCAYDCYINRFEDEGHILILLSPSDKMQADWKVGIYLGEDAAQAVNDAFVTQFNHKLEEELSKNQPTETAVGATLTDLASGARSENVRFAAYNGSFLLKIFLIILLSVIYFSYIIIRYRQYFGAKQKAFNTAMPCPKVVVEANCKYCTGLYVVGAHMNCPHCGAPTEKENCADPF